MNRKATVLGIVLFAAMLYLSTYAHEGGHALMCRLAGYDTVIVIQPYTFETRLTLCSERPADPTWYWAMGGIMGMVASVVPVLVFRKYPLVVAASLPHVAANAITGTMETFVNEWYKSSSEVAAVIASSAMMSIFIILLLRHVFTRIDPPPIIGKDGNS